jgi:predicted nucleic acid-binding Zn ribbon protein
MRMTWQDDGPDEEWVEDEADDDADDRLTCPECGEDVHEDAQQCPHCRQWITPVDRRDSGRKLIWLVAAVLLILVFSGVLLL